MYPPPPLDARLGKNEQDKLRNRGLKIESVMHTVTRRVTHRPIFRRLFSYASPFMTVLITLLLSIRQSFQTRSVK